MNPSGQTKVGFFIGGLAVLAILINVWFSKPTPRAPVYQQPYPVQTAPTPPLQVYTPARVATTEPAPYQVPVVSRQEEIARQQADAAAEAAAKAAADHASFLARYLNDRVTRKTGVKNIAVVFSFADGKPAHDLSDALTARFKDGTVQLLANVFKPAFVSDGLFGNVYRGSTDILTKLEIADSLDAILLVKEDVRYTTSPALENVISAHMNLDVVLLPLRGETRARSWKYVANGPGFRREDARSMAVERVIKQITADTTLSLAEH